MSKLYKPEVKVPEHTLEFMCDMLCQFCENILCYESKCDTCIYGSENITDKDKEYIKEQFYKVFKK